MPFMAKKTCAFTTCVGFNPCHGLGRFESVGWLDRCGLSESDGQRSQQQMDHTQCGKVARTNHLVPVSSKDDLVGRGG